MFSPFIAPHLQTPFTLGLHSICSQNQSISSFLNCLSQTSTSLQSSCFSDDNLLSPHENRPHKEWHFRGYLPHFDHPDIVQAITFRLFDSVPAVVIEKWRAQLKIAGNEPADDYRCVILRERIEKYSDLGNGACWLRKPRIAAIMQDVLLYFDGQRYRLLAWCIMPNHIHALIETMKNFLLSDIIHSWKSFSAKKINQVLQQQGKVWMPEYHDRFIRNKEHYLAVEKYIAENPVKAKLCQKPEDWPWSHRRMLAPDTY